MSSRAPKRSGRRQKRAWAVKKNAKGKVADQQNEKTAASATTATPQPTPTEEAPKKRPEPLDFRKGRSNHPSKRGASGSSANNTRRYTLSKPVFFVGFMGAGKTSVSRKLARICRLTSIDMDTYIERQEDCTVSEIFSSRGEAGFRAVETQVLRKLADSAPALIGCGGGVVTTPVNRDILREAGCVVFLRVTAAEAKGRISDLSTRPLFNELEEAERRNLARLPLYQEVADIEIDTAGKNVNTIAHEVRRELQKRGILCVQ